jgi:hypothetical protein
MYGWFFLMAGFMAFLTLWLRRHLGVAFFWPFDTARYLLPWRPLLSVPMAVSAHQGPLWRAVVVECWLFGTLLGGLFVLTRLVAAAWGKLATRVPA